MLDKDLIRRVIEPELNDERLLWFGRPRAALACVTWPSTGTFAFGVIWTAWCLFLPYLFGAQTDLRDPYLIPFILFGLVFLLSPIWYYWEAQRTVYGITDKRVLIVVNRKTRNVESFGPSDIGGIKAKQRGGGSGDIRFAWRQYRDNTGESWQEVRLVGIPDVCSVEKLLRDTFESKPAPT